jgi:hypothetical protein
MRLTLILSLSVLVIPPASAADLSAMSNAEIAAMYSICLQGRKPICGSRGCVPLGDWPAPECVNIQVETHRRAEAAPKPKPPVDDPQARIDWLNGMTGQ